MAAGMPRIMVAAALNEAQEQVSTQLAQGLLCI